MPYARAKSWRRIFWPRFVAAGKSRLCSLRSDNWRLSAGEPGWRISWGQFFWISGLVVVADDLSQQTATLREEGACGPRLDLGPPLLQGSRAVRHPPSTNDVAAGTWQSPCRSHPCQQYQERGRRQIGDGVTVTPRVCRGAPGMIHSDQDICTNLNAACKREWMETNVLEGCTASTIRGRRERDRKIPLHLSWRTCHHRGVHGEETSQSVRHHKVQTLLAYGQQAYGTRARDIAAALAVHLTDGGVSRL
jgi:hypothetical protein